MSYAEIAYPGQYTIAADAPAETRADFLNKTYLHLSCAIATFVLLEMALLSVPNIGNMVAWMISGWNWLIVLGAFMVVSYVAERWAVSAVSLPAQYLGLGLYIVAQAVIFLPLLFIASRFGGESVIPTAGLITLVTFIGLSAIVFVTRKDFSFLKAALGLATLIAFGFILCSILIGFDPGMLFTVAMIGIASGYVLYYTSNVLHHYHIGQHVAASLALFASVALLFWYVLQLVMSLNSD